MKDAGDYRLNTILVFVLVSTFVIVLDITKYEDLEEKEFLLLSGRN